MGWVLLRLLDVAREWEEEGEVAELRADLRVMEAAVACISLVLAPS